MFPLNSQLASEAKSYTPQSKMAPLERGGGLNFSASRTLYTRLPSLLLCFPPLCAFFIETYYAMLQICFRYFFRYIPLPALSSPASRSFRRLYSRVPAKRGDALVGTDQGNIRQSRGIDNWPSTRIHAVWMITTQSYTALIAWNTSLAAACWVTFSLWNKF